MKISELCMRRPVATMMLWVSVVVAGVVCWLQLPISALPKYETPTIQVEANMPGASPETMSTSIATPLEKEFSAIPNLVQSTSESIQGQTVVILQFDPSRKIDAAAADVQAALFRITRALPAELPAPPSYSKINPGDAPILSVGLCSPTMTLAELNAYIDGLVVPALSTIDGVAQVQVTGRKRYAVRVEVDPERLAARDLTLLDVSNALKTANSNAPIGQLDNKRQMLALQMSGGLLKADDFAKLIIATRQGQSIRLSEIANVVDSIENVQNTSEINGRNSVLLQIKRQPGANTVQTVDAIRQLLPKLQSQLPGSVRIQTLNDRSIPVRNAIHDVNLTMLLTISLVIMVMLVFLRHFTATLIPSITLPISLFGTFGLMYLLGLSLNNISLMGLTIAVGLVVDDAIVVLENIMRYIEDGMKPFDAAVKGASEVGFTVISISISLVAVFIPIFFMPGMIGLLFHEFAIVVSLSILVSAAVSLTLIPVLVPMLIKKGYDDHTAAGWTGAFERLYESTLNAYRRGLEWALTHRTIVLLIGASTFVLTGWLYAVSPKGFFPQEDVGQIQVKIVAPEDMSYEGRLALLRQVQARLRDEPAIQTLASKVDHDTTAFLIDLKPQGQRPPMAQVLSRLRKEANFLPSIKVNFSPVQNLKVGSSSSSSSYQYTLQSVGGDPLDEWAANLLTAMKNTDVFVGLDTDTKKNGLQAEVKIDRDKAALLGVDMATIRSTLYAAYGERQVSSIFAPQATYSVIMEIAGQNRRDESDLSKIYVRSANSGMVPLSAFATVTRSMGSTMVTHQARLPAVTISFELAPGKSLSDAALAIEAAKREVKLPTTVFGSFGGQAALFQQSQTSQLWLIVIAIAVIYVVLGVLYESWIHPITILLGIPSAAVGALLALRLLGMELTFIAMIGILLLIGIVKKNAIMMIDFAIDAQRNKGATSEEAIRQACVLRFRPIMMTTFCAIMGALPIALGLGAGAELRQPLGVSIVGGLIFSQFITLFITPVLYLWFDQLAHRKDAPIEEGATVPGLRPSRV